MHHLRKWSDGPTAGNRGIPLALSPWRLHCQFCLWRLPHYHVFPLVLEGTGKFATPVYDFWVDATACCEIQVHAARPPAARCQQVCHIGTWPRAKRLFGHGMPKLCVGGRRYKAKGPNRQGQAAHSRQRNQGDPLGWQWIPASLRTSTDKKANHHRERKSEVPHSPREKLCPERWTFQKVKKFWRSRNVLIYI